MDILHGARRRLGFAAALIVTLLALPTAVMASTLPDEPPVDSTTTAAPPTTVAETTTTAAPTTTAPTTTAGPTTTAAQTTTALATSAASAAVGPSTTTPPMPMLASAVVTVPSAPQRVRVLPSFGILYISWDNNATADGGSPITGWVIQLSRSSSSGWTTIARRPAATDAFAVTGLSDGTLYYVRVAAVNALGQGHVRDGVRLHPRAVSGLQPLRRGRPILRDVQRVVVFIREERHCERFRNRQGLFVHDDGHHDLRASLSGVEREYCCGAAAQVQLHEPSHWTHEPVHAGQSQWSAGDTPVPAAGGDGGAVEHHDGDRAFQRPGIDRWRCDHEVHGDVHEFGWRHPAHRYRYVERGGRLHTHTPSSLHLHRPRLQRRRSVVPLGRVRGIHRPSTVSAIGTAGRDRCTIRHHGRGDGDAARVDGWLGDHEVHSHMYEFQRRGTSNRNECRSLHVCLGRVVDARQDLHVHCPRLQRGRPVLPITRIDAFHRIARPRATSSPQEPGLRF